MADDPLRALLNCGRDFRDARNHKGEYAFDQWRAIVSECNNALRKLWNDGWLRTIPGIQESESNFPVSLVSNAWLSHRLIGFDDFEMNEIGSWYFMPGLIHQDPIFICNEFEGEMADRDDLPSFGEMWDRHGFMILGRYASACELIVEIVEREMASRKGNGITITVAGHQANYGSPMPSVDIHAAISMLRHLSDEFKEARRIPVGERMEVAKSIGMRASAALCQCWNLGYLRSIPSLQQRFEDLRNQTDSIPGFLGEIWFEQYLLSNLVGYGGAVVKEVLDDRYETNDEGEEISYEITQEYMYLPSGILAKDGLLITPDIFLGPVPMSDGEIATAASEHAFEVLGYYSQGCEVLASIIEREMASKREDKDAGGSACVDGLHAENRMLVWGGVSFPLTTNQSIVFRLLIDAYQGGGGDVFKNDIEDELGGGALRDSFRRNHNGAKVYDPSWYLIDKGSRKDSKRMIDPSVVRANPEKFSDPQRNPQRSPE